MSRIKLILLSLVFTSCIPGFEKHEDNDTKHKRQVLSQTDSLLRITDKTLISKELRGELEENIIDSLKKQLLYELSTEDQNIHSLNNKIEELKGEVDGYKLLLDELKELREIELGEMKEELEKTQGELKLVNSQFNALKIKYGEDIKNKDTVIIYKVDTIYVDPPNKSKNKK